jgi:hypothetical protein
MLQMLNFDFNVIEVPEYLFHRGLKHLLHNLVVEDLKKIDLGEEGEVASRIAEDKKVALDVPVPVVVVVVDFHMNPAVAVDPAAVEDIVVGILLHHHPHHPHMVNHELSQTIGFQPLSQVSSSHREQLEFIAPKGEILS